LAIVFFVKVKYKQPVKNSSPYPIWYASSLRQSRPAIADAIAASRPVWGLGGPWQPVPAGGIGSQGEHSLKVG